MIWKLYDDKSNHFFTGTFDHVPGLSHYLGWDFIYKEIFDWEFSSTGCIYEMWDCHLKENDVVVDLGASVGFFSQKASGLASKVIAVDGSPENFSCLVENTKDSKNIFCLNASVVGEDSPPPYLWTTKGNPLQISLEDVFELYGLEKIDFLKCDIEGGEYDLFNSTPQEVLDKIDRIAIETHYPDRNDKFEIPGKTKHKFTWWFPGGEQIMLYFTTPKAI